MPIGTSDQDNDTAPVEPKEAPEKTAAPSPSKKDKYEVPKDDPFDIDNMMKFADHMELFGSELKKGEPEKKEEPGDKEVKAKEAEPKEGEPKKSGDKPGPDEKKKEPYKVLKVNGKEIPVSSEEELIAIAQKNLNATQMRQQDAEWERQLKEREQAIKEKEALFNSRIEGPMKEFVDAFKSGKKLPFGGDETLTEDDLFSQSELDPVVRKYITDLKKEVADLKGKVGEADQVTKQVKLKEAAETLTKTFEQIKQEFPFEEIDDEEIGSITGKIIPGLVSVFLQEDAMKRKNNPSHPVKPVGEFLRMAAQTMNKLEAYYKKNGKPAEASKVDITEEYLNENHSDLIAEIGRKAVVNYLEEKEGNPSFPSPRIREAAKPHQKSAGKFEGLEDSIESALNDPDIARELFK